MGVPAFFRWMARRYPNVISDVADPKDGDDTRPNVNFQEFDNVYLDMNGIIHPCTHPEDMAPPRSEEEMFELIFAYIDRLFSILRPRRLLYMAIDGVAPRAKMNQQRSRRFRTAMEAQDKREQIEAIRKQMATDGIPLPPERNQEGEFDSNCITPGTQFMDRLAVALKAYIDKRRETNPAWQTIRVVLSSSNVPGEGEHKIMEFIRQERDSPGHDPKLAHCLCGADADLIMLGLATHLENFTVIREEFTPNTPKPCEICSSYGHDMKDCQGLARGPGDPPLPPKRKSFLFIRLDMLRAYLRDELTVPNASFPFDLRRAIDDWVFLCFFAGNDFLPHLPSLEIREGAIDRLVNIYKRSLPALEGWLTDNGEIFADRIKVILGQLGHIEDEIFKMRRARDAEQEARECRRLSLISNVSAPGSSDYSDLSASLFEEGKRIKEAERELKAILGIGTKRPHPGDLGGPEPKLLKNAEGQRTIPNRLSQGAVSSTPSSGTVKQQAVPAGGATGDEVRLWEPGWKERYYRLKFGVDLNTESSFGAKVASAYMEGLCWVLRYYYRGCASWTWFYAYHYAPFASDFVSIDDGLKPDFSTPTEPFKPLEQLMAVFPNGSSEHIPPGWRHFMWSEESPIADFYPSNFKTDLNGKRFAWQGVTLLPFVDEKRLLEVLANAYDLLTPEEHILNRREEDLVFEPLVVKQAVEQRKQSCVTPKSVENDEKAIEEESARDGAATAKRDEAAATGDSGAATKGDDEAAATEDSGAATKEDDEAAATEDSGAAMKEDDEAAAREDGAND